jgi:predicted nucleic acid-binding protein
VYSFRLPVSTEAAPLCASHGLRVYDAVQLSSALAVRRVDEGCTEFAAFDRLLRTAAAAERFELIPPNLPDRTEQPARNQDA